MSDKRRNVNCDYVTITTDSKSIWWWARTDHKVYLHNTNNYQMQQLYLVNIGTHQTHLQALGKKYRPTKNTVCLQKISQMTWTVTSLYWFNSGKNITSQSTRGFIYFL